MLKDGRGAGLLAKIRGMHLSHALGLDTADAYQHLGIPLDPRDYEYAAYILRHLSIPSLRLLTNNPRKIQALQRKGFEVRRDRLETKPTPHNPPPLPPKPTHI